MMFLPLWLIIYLMTHITGYLIKGFIDKQE